jgi:predicted Zn-ribbon and HTH transcriptional regulator
MSKAGKQMLAGLTEILDNMDYILERQNFLRDNPPKCVFCGTLHTQLMKINEPALWHCPKCKGKFSYEPPLGPSGSVN